ncbi:hypothetical protein E4T56_gene9084, partial [Termitomyces sp. T112]
MRKGAIVIAQIIAPFARLFRAHDGLRAIRPNTQQAQRQPTPVIGIQFHRGQFGGLRRIAQLRMRNHRAAQPSGTGLGPDGPCQHHPAFARRQQRAHYEPAVLRLITPIIEHDG